MLIRTSGAPQPNLYLLTLGNTCRYAIGTDRITLTDPGAPAHAPLLLERLHALNLSFTSIERIVLTALTADRVGAIPALRSRIPQARLTCTTHQASCLRHGEYQRRLYEEILTLAPLTGATDAPPSFADFVKALTPDVIVAESEVLECSGDVNLRVFPLPGHTAESIGFLVEPYGFLIGDEVLGYYRGRNLAAPGCDASLELSLESLQKLDKLPLTALCLPNDGVLTGALVRKHLHALMMNTGDLEREVKTALDNDVAHDLIIKAIRDSFYLTDSRDPFVLRRLEITLQALIRRFGLVANR